MTQLKIGDKVWFDGDDEPLPAVIEYFSERHGMEIVGLICESDDPLARDRWDYTDGMRRR